ncbi:hypothetical protein B5E53_09540 [Eubacterium sp. An11]|uniref:hypothetical protein n=1 Tax=Eubacterium sp. An11 TaxID=1965542 RepID=UPI000B3A3A8E|nr:hypothetical protein [Eubacterium sp. An11]OUQ67022.1 hypothetical protein B5E53_09540 [Eubacterium sp. An11]
MKTLYIHIGTPKTGTTSLQHFCTENAKLFEEQGYCYPIFPHKFKYINIMRNGFFLSYKGYDENKNRNQMEEAKFFRQGMDFILDNFQKFDNIILSDEAIWNVVFKRGKTDLWERLKKEADEHDYVIKVVVYLRRQDSLATSWWNQKIKIGKRVYSKDSWENFVKDPTKFELEYYDSLKFIEKFVEKENIIVRRFGRQYFKNGSIFEDFIDAVGMRYSSHFVISEGQRNVSLVGNTHEIKRILNTIPDLRDQDNKFFRSIVIDMSEQRPDLKKETMFSPEEALKFMEQYREGNRKIMKEYFGKDEDLFDMDFSKNQKWVLDYKEMEKDIIQFMGRAIIELRKENKDLKKRVKETERELSEQKEILKNIQVQLDNPLKTVFSFVRKKK